MLPSPHRPKEMATLANLLGSDSDDFSSGEEAETPRVSADAHTNAEKNEIDTLSNQESDKQVSCQLTEAETAARKK